MKRTALMAAGCGLVVAAVLGLRPGQAGPSAIGAVDTAPTSSGALVQVDGAGHLRARCAGFLASRTVFVTAQRCFLMFGIPDGSTASVSLDTAVSDRSTVLYGVAHYTLTSGLGSDAHQLGVIELRAPVAGRAPLGLPAFGGRVTFRTGGQLVSVP